MIVMAAAIPAKSIPIIPNRFVSFFSINAAHDMAQILAAETVKVVASTLICVSPNSWLNTENIAMSAVSDRKPIKLQRKILRMSDKFI